MKRLLFLAPHPFFQERGTPIANLAAIRVLAERGYEVDVLTYHEGEDVEVPGCTIHRIPAIPGVRDIQPGFSLKKVVSDVVMAGKGVGLARRGYDLVHAVEEAVFLAVVFRWTHGIPFVYDMDSSLPEQMANQVGGTRALLPLMTRMERFAVRRASGVLTMCRSLEDQARALAPRTLVGRAEDVTILSGENGTERLRETVGASGPIVLYVGNLMPYQGIDLLLNGFRIAASDHPDAHLVLVGGSEERREHYAGMARRLGVGERVHLVGRRPLRHLGWYLQQATVLVSTRNRGENTPMKLYSYLDSGVPVLATRLPTHTQVVDDETAMLCEPEAGDVARGLDRLLSDPGLRARIATAAGELVQREYTPEAFARKVNGFYDRVERGLGLDRPRARAAAAHPDGRAADGRSVDGKRGPSPRSRHLRALEADAASGSGQPAGG